jgi:ABC-type glycerol-3-phosphate transport system substrate-binding protein
MKTSLRRRLALTASLMFAGGGAAVVMPTASSAGTVTPTAACLRLQTKLTASIARTEAAHTKLETVTMPALVAKFNLATALGNSLRADAISLLAQRQNLLDDARVAGTKSVSLFAVDACSDPELRWIPSWQVCGSC